MIKKRRKRRSSVSRRRRVSRPVDKKPVSTESESLFVSMLKNPREAWLFIPAGIVMVIFIVSLIHNLRIYWH